ncbi:MAG: FAD-dependent oxidoreductase [Phycisphaerae bacterium]|nr:FAD-dependent oxidoreductase [Phycisphaerae bacterium]
MAEHERFRYESIDDLTADVERLGLDLPVTDDIAVLAQPVPFAGAEAPNRFAVHPMEGCDGMADGAPSELVFRRYRRFGAGGAGLIWFEACAILPQARANPRQLWIHQGTVDAFARLVEQTRKAAADAVGHNPVLVLQLTHSGRYSKPKGKPEPIIAQHSGVLDPRSHLPADYPLITDDELDALQDQFVVAAKLAKQAGFDAVDVKACHGYLMSELLGSHTRADSRYGGSFENRTRLLRESAARIRSEVPGLAVTSRMNLYDAYRYPFGWGVDKEDYHKPDMTEPLRLVGMLKDIGYRGLNCTIANPYYNPHYGRPFDEPVGGGYYADEHPLEGVARMIDLAGHVQQAYPDLPVVGTGYSWLREYMPYVAAAAVKQGRVSIVGLGRGSIAYPDYARDLLSTGRMEPTKVCIACSSCTQIMRDGGRAGCVVRDHEVYGPIFQQGRRSAPDEIRRKAKACRECIAPTCSRGCPAGVRIPQFLRAVADGDDRQAYRILREANLLPEMCAYVCPVEVQCEGHCVQQWIGDGALPIRDIQRYVARRAREQGWTEISVPAKATGRCVAVIGAGPAGLACAAKLLEHGERVTVFEKGSRPGGKAGQVIPLGRLSSDLVTEEIESIFKAAPADRLEWRFSMPLTPERNLDGVWSEGGYDAVCLTFGLGRSPGLTDEAPPEGVFDANDFLATFNSDPLKYIEGVVAVIGGGNTAMDAATMAVERGASDVYLIYRRSFAQMPAWPNERERCVRAGVHFLILTQPLKYVPDGQGRLKEIWMVRTRLGAPDASGRRRPEPIDGTEHKIPIDWCVEAIGERPPAELLELLPGVQTTHEGLLAVDVGPSARKCMTNREGVFAAGDLVNGGTTVVQAAAEGYRAAESIVEFLNAKS